ncbi:MAG TPA: hypothetical protein VFZ34_18260 [Blastocatellia bacterium]|nr:hypothetical protein [Blastocatellia bacterium]
MQISLALRYKELLRQGSPLPSFDEVEFRAYSQNGEDGILLYIFSLIGTTNKQVVEICAGDGIECNSANLIIHHGWEALLFDGNEAIIQKGRAFYTHHPDTFLWPPRFVHAWITPQNINALIQNNGFSGSIDLLSLDLDSVDYWIWKAIDVIQPRVVVVEYQDAWGPEKAVTVACEQEFSAATVGTAGASLAAFVKLSKAKGYRLVGCQRYGFNAFFVQNGIAEDVLPEIDPKTVFHHPRHKEERDTARLHQHKWVEV